MKLHRSLCFPFALAVCFGSAWADGGKTREQVRAEYLEAVRTGDLVAGDSGLKLNELYPDRYPAKPTEPGKSRAQVMAELEEAQRSGELEVGETGLKLHEAYPDRYPRQAAGPGKTRAEVLAELEDARLLGDVPLGEDSLTPAERTPWIYAAVRAEHAAQARIRAQTETLSLLNRP